MARGMPAREGTELLFCSKPPGLHTISARSPCAAIRQCPVPTHPLSPVYPSYRPHLQRERLVLEGHSCWKVKKHDIDAGKSWDILRERQTRAMCGSCFEHTGGDSSCQTKQLSENQPEACLSWWIQKHFQSPGSGQPSHFPAVYRR